jgi:hypothetical protein
MAETKQLVIDLPIEVADRLEQKAAEAKLPLQVIVMGQLFQWLGYDQIGYAPRAYWAKNRGVTMGAGALAAEAAELDAQRHLEEQGIMICTLDAERGTVCVPKEMLPAELEQKINAESLTRTDPGWLWWLDASGRTRSAAVCMDAREWCESPVPWRRVPQTLTISPRQVHGS